MAVSDENHACAVKWKITRQVSTVYIDLLQSKLGVGIEDLASAYSPMNVSSSPGRDVSAPTLDNHQNTLHCHSFIVFIVCRITQNVTFDIRFIPQLLILYTQIQ